MDKYINNQLPSEENMENTNSSENNEQILENSKLSFSSNAEKNEYLKQCWSIKENSSFIFIGKIKRIPTNYSGDLYMLDHVFSETGQLKYPDSKGNVSIYIGTNIEDKLKENDLKEGDLVKYQANKLNFSSTEEQKKKKSVFVFSIKNINDLIKVNKIPKEVFSIFLSKINDEGYLEDWVINQHYEIKDIREKTEKQKKEITDEYNEKTIQLESEYKKKEEENKSNLASLEKEYQEGRLKCDEIKKEYNEIKLQKDNAEKELNEVNQKLSDSLEKTQSLLENSKKKILLLAQLGVIERDDAYNLLNKETPHNVVPPFTGSPEEAIDQIQFAIYNKGSLYSKSLLRNFCALLNTYDLILFAGDSGIGKTNLVKRFAEAVGGVSKIIPVKPNWTSSDDIIGYYNPLEKRYVSTPFLDAIYEAQENPNKLFLICLDEMNLARIEYYFADFLCKLEERSEDPLLELYSENEDKFVSDNTYELVDKLSSSIEVDSTFLEDGTTKTYTTIDPQINKNISDLRKIHSKWRRENKVKIPQNIRFIGTLNVDDTTYYLSPKILDRVHIIKFENPIFIDRKAIEEEINSDIEGSLTINPRSFFDPRANYPDFFTKQDSSLVERLVSLSERLSGLSLSYGARVINQSLLYSESMKKFGEVNEDAIFNNILLQKVFPRLLVDGSDYASDGSSKTKIEVLDEIYTYLKTEFNESDALSCLKELERVINRAKNGNSQINYWIR